ncbi:MAG TPA: endonuclease/exonuclease/phosphatase family protein [Candidatus Binatia bacterium]
MIIRIATLNLEQNHKRWQTRRDLVVQQLGGLKPDMLALNEIYTPEQTGRWLQSAAADRFQMKYALLQQSKVGDDSRTEAEGLMTRYPVIETASLDYRSHNCVALVARFEIDKRSLDVYVTHLIAARVEDTARQYQAQRLLDWLQTRRDADFSVMCGDFNAAPDQPSMRLMSGPLRPTQFQPTAFTPLQEPGGKPSHPEWERFDRCIDYIWVTASIEVRASGLCFNQPAPNDPMLWPSDHVGVWADLELA